MDRFLTWRRQAFATENFPWGSFREQKARLLTVAHGTRDQVVSLVRTPGEHPVLVLALLLGLLAILGDSYSTFLMADLPGFTESNLVAAGLQDLLGLGGYAVLATFLSLLLLPLLLVRGGNIIAWLLVSAGITFLLFKGYVAYSNFHLLFTAF